MIDADIMQYLKLTYNNNKAYSYLCSTSIAIIEFYDDFIEKITCSAGTFDSVMSKNGMTFIIAKMKCRSIEEFLISLDLNDCIFNVGVEPANDKAIEEKYVKCLQEKEMLKSENETLKSKLIDIQKSIVDVI